ncbi:MAG: DNA recombination protein RmuC [Bacteroidales bacterium]|nr:DNA recombination protein RmuC [Bacteroidales bacterium]
METILISALIILLIITIVIIFLLKNEINRRFIELKNEQKDSFDSLKQEVLNSLNIFKESTESSNSLSRELLKEKMEQLEKSQQEMIKQTDTKLEYIRVNVGEKLETIRSTVDEKLEKTLSDRLGKSFETVGKQLIEVQKGLGEMQNLAQDVGGLKRVLSNVKMRGGFGEVQLSMLLEQILAPGQYEQNVHPKPRGSSVVEFAVKLPGKDDQMDQVWLPIDAKFPKESYEKLQIAYDKADPIDIESEQAALYRDIKKMAADIRDKYIVPPYTTDFAIMFLPFEGIYAEVVRSATLLQELQTQYKVIVTGPTTLAAILNSLQMGFRTLAIQKRSSEVWKVLSGVKKEFDTFGSLLSKAKNNIQGGLNTIDDLVGVRTRQIQSKLRNVELLDQIEQDDIDKIPEKDNLID